MARTARNEIASLLRPGGFPALAAVPLAFQRMRRTWGLLLITGIGMVATVMLVCAVPLYTQVAMTAGLRGVLSTNPQNADIVVAGTSRSISPPFLNNVNSSLERIFQKDLGAYLESSQFSIETGFLPMLAPTSGHGSLPSYHPTGDRMSLYGVSPRQSISHVRLLAGRLPAASSQDIEIAMHEEAASGLRVGVGSIIPVSFTLQDANLNITAHVLNLHIVGIFTLPTDNDPFWHGVDFQGVSTNSVFAQYQVMASNDTLLQRLAQLSNEHPGPFRIFQLPSNLIWNYHLDTRRLRIDQLDAVITGIQNVQLDDSNNQLLEESPMLESTSTLQSSFILEQYRSRVAVAQLPITSFLLFMGGLVLFFISLMATLLVERQAETIAVLRSRGASRLQVSGALALQSILLGLVALAAGPLLAIPITRLLAQQLLPTADQGALNVLSGSPATVALGVSLYALLAVLLAVVAMTLAMLGAANRDILAMRRETARSTHRPLWQRLNLDIVAAVIAVVGFIFSLYATNTNALDAHLRLLLLSPLTLLGTVLLLLAGLLLLVRLFPALLRGGSWLAARRRGATPLLALAQMARAPRQAARTTLLLALASALAIFVLVFNATQSQRVLDVAAYTTGADFSGTVPLNLYAPNQLASVTASYRQQPGVLSASMGLVKSATGGGPTATVNINFQAVDTSTFAQTAIWPTQDAQQPLAPLMARLRAQRASGIARLVVPAIVDTTAWNALHLAQGETFTLNFSPNAYADLVNFQVIAEVPYIPNSGDASVGGVLADYLTYADVSTHHFTQAGDYASPLNYVWLRTSDNAARLASLRHLLTQTDLRLDPLLDRRAMISTFYQEPLYLALTGVLSLGMVIALLLALVGNLLSSWLSARTRLTNFAVLRALGAAPRQVAGVLAWEQAIIYVTAILEGIIFGMVLAFLAIPALVFSSVLPNNLNGSISASDFYAVQTAPAINIVMPPSVLYTLAGLAAICVIAIVSTALLVARPSIGQTLRLNQD